MNTKKNVSSTLIKPTNSSKIPTIKKTNSTTVNKATTSVKKDTTSLIKPPSKGKFFKFYHRSKILREYPTILLQYCIKFKQMH